MRDPAHDFHAGPPLEPRAQRAVPHEDETAPPQALEGLCEPNDILPLGQAADADEDRPVAVPRRRSEQLEVDAAVDDMRLALRLGDLQLELAAEVVGDGDQSGRAANDETGCGGDSGIGADVADIAPVGRDDQRLAGRDGRGEAGRDQEVRVHDIGVKSPRDAGGLRCEPEVTTLAAGARVEHRALDLMPPVAERALDLSDERAQIGVVRPRVHLRDEQDSQLGRVLRVVRAEDFAQLVRDLSDRAAEP